MTETIRGVIEKVFYASPEFSTGLMRSAEGRHIRFRAELYAAPQQYLAAEGEWERHRTHGWQFVIALLCYELPDSPDGLAHYLASHPMFKGIGPANAAAIVQCAPSADQLDRALRHWLSALSERTGIGMDRLGMLQEAWVAHSAENEVRIFLSSFSLTPNQMDTLLDRFGHPRGPSGPWP